MSNDCQAWRDQPRETKDGRFCPGDPGYPNFGIDLSRPEDGGKTAAKKNSCQEWKHEPRTTKDGRFCPGDPDYIDFSTIHKIDKK